MNDIYNTNKKTRHFSDNMSLNFVDLIVIDDVEYNQYEIVITVDNVDIKYNIYSSADLLDEKIDDKKLGDLIIDKISKNSNDKDIYINEGELELEEEKRYSSGVTFDSLLDKIKKNTSLKDGKISCPIEFTDGGPEKFETVVGMINNMINGADYEKVFAGKRIDASILPDEYYEIRNAITILMTHVHVDDGGASALLTFSKFLSEVSSVMGNVYADWVELQYDVGTWGVNTNLLAKLEEVDKSRNLTGDKSLATKYSNMFVTDYNELVGGLRSGEKSWTTIGDAYSAIASWYSYITIEQALTFVDGTLYEKRDNFFRNEKGEYVPKEELSQEQLEELEIINNQIEFMESIFQTIADNQLSEGHTTMEEVRDYYSVNTYELATLISDATLNQLVHKLENGYGTNSGYSDKDMWTSTITQSVNDFRNYYYTTREGQQKLLDTYINDPDKNPFPYDETNAMANTQLIMDCIVSGHTDWLLPELRIFVDVIMEINANSNMSNLKEIDPVILARGLNIDETVALNNKIDELGNGREENALGIYNIVSINGKLYKREYTDLGEAMLYYMDYHCGEFSLNSGEDRYITAFSKGGQNDALYREAKGSFIEERAKEYFETGAYSRDRCYIEAELDFNILNDMNLATDEKYMSRYNSLIKEGYVAFEDMAKVAEILYVKDLSEVTRELIEENEDKLIRAGYNANFLKKFFYDTFDANLSENKTNSNLMQIMGMATVGKPLTALMAAVNIAQGVFKFGENIWDQWKTIANSNSGLLELKDVYADLLPAILNDYDKYVNIDNKIILDFLRGDFDLNTPSLASLHKERDEKGNIVYGVWVGKELVRYTNFDEIPSEYIEEAINEARDYVVTQYIQEHGWITGNQPVNAYIDTFTHGIRHIGDPNTEPFELFEDLPYAVISSATKQLEVEEWVQRDRTQELFDKLYEKEWFKKIEAFSIVQHDNFLGQTFNQVGNMAIPVLVGRIPVIGEFLSGVLLFNSAFGAAVEEAFNYGVGDYSGALAYGTVSATLELVIEKMFGGIEGIGVGSLDDILKGLANLIAPNANSVTAAIIKNLIVKGVGEGIEEVFTDLINPIIQGLTYNTELAKSITENGIFDTILDNVSLDQLFTTFIISALSSSVFGSVNTAITINKFNKAMNKLYENAFKQGIDMDYFESFKNTVLAGIISETLLEGENVTSNAILEQMIIQVENQVNENPNFANFIHIDDFLTQLKEMKNDMDVENITINLSGKDSSSKESNESTSDTTQTETSESINNSTVISRNELMRLIEILNFKGKFTIENNELVFSDPKDQAKFTKALYEYNEKILKGQKASLSKLIEKYKKLDNKSDLSALNDAIDLIIQNNPLIAFAVKENLSKNLKLEIGEGENKRVISIPAVIADAIIGKENYKVGADNKIILENGITEKNIADNVYDATIKILENNKTYLDGKFDTFKEAIKNGDNSLINEALNNIKPILLQGKNTVVVSNSTAVADSNYVKLEVQVIKDGRVENVNVYVDNTTDASLYKNDKVLDKIKDIINKNKGKENIYAGEISIDEKTGEVTTKQNDTGKSYVDSISNVTVAGVAAASVSSGVVSTVNTNTSTTTTASTVDTNTKTDAKTNKDTVVEEVNETTKAPARLTIPQLKAQMESYIESLKKEFNQFIETHKNDPDFNTKLENFKTEKTNEFSIKLLEANGSISTSYSERIHSMNLNIEQASDESVRKNLITQRDALIKEMNNEITDFAQSIRGKFNEVINSFVANTTTNTSNLKVVTPSVDGKVVLGNVAAVAPANNSADVGINYQPPIVPTKALELYELNNPNPEITIQNLEFIAAQLKTELFKLKAASKLIIIKPNGGIGDVEMSKVIESIKVFSDSLKKAHAKTIPIIDTSIIKAIEIVTNKTLTEIEVYDKLSLLNVEANLPKGYNEFTKLYKKNLFIFSKTIKALEGKGYSSIEIGNILVSYAYQQNNQTKTYAIYQKAFDYLTKNGISKDYAIDILRMEAKRTIASRGTRLLGVTESGVEIRIVNNSGKVKFTEKDIDKIILRAEKICTKTDLKQVIINDTFNPDDIYWANNEEYSKNNRPSGKNRIQFTSAGCADADVIYVWEIISDITLLVHEYGHTVDRFLAKTTGRTFFSDGREYTDAIAKDKEITTSPISNYATTNNCEDFAEFMHYFEKNPVDIGLAYPNRYMVLHSVGANMKVDSKLIVEFINKYEYGPEIIFNKISKILSQNEKITVKELINDFVNGKQINTHGNILIEDILNELDKMYPNRSVLLSKLPNNIDTSIDSIAAQEMQKVVVTESVTETVTDGIEAFDIGPKATYVTANKTNNIETFDVGPNAIGTQSTEIEMVDAESELNTKKTSFVELTKESLNIKIEPSILLEYIEGKTQLPESYSYTELIQALSEVVKYVKRNQITLSESITGKIDELYSILVEHGGIVVNLQEFFNGKAAIMVDSYIRFNYELFPTVNIIDILKMNNESYIKALRENIYGINSDTNQSYLFEIIENMFNENTRLKDMYYENYAKLKDIAENSYLYKDGTIFPKNFGKYTSEFIANILQNPNIISKYTGIKRNSIIKAAKQYVEFARKNSTQEHYEADINALKFINKKVSKINSNIAIKSKSYYDFDMNERKGGTFGAKQNAIAQALEKYDITRVVSGIFGKDSNVKQFLSNINGHNITDSEFNIKIESLMSIEDRKQFSELLDQVRENFSTKTTKVIDGKEVTTYDMSKFDALKVLYLLETTEAGGTGICNYAAGVNLILNAYRNNPDAFLRDFHYPMHIDGDITKPLNTARLLVDLYTSINKDVFVRKNENGSYDISTSSKRYLHFTNLDGEVDMNLFEKFLKEKNISITLDKTFAYDSTNSDGLMHYEEVIKQIYKSLKNGEHVDVSSGGYNLTNLDGKTTVSQGSAHIMTVLGITNDGNLIVDNYGKKEIFHLKDIMQRLDGHFLTSSMSHGKNFVQIVSYKAETNKLEIHDKSRPQSIKSSSVFQQQNLETFDVAHENNVEVIDESKPSIKPQTPSTSKNINVESYTKINSDIAVVAKTYIPFKQNQQSGGTFGADQGAVKTLFEKVKMKEALGKIINEKFGLINTIDKLIFGKKAEDRIFLKELSKLDMTEDQFKKMLTDASNGLLTTSDIKLVDSYVKQVQSIIEGISYTEAVHFLYLMEGLESFDGICNYASMTNMIFNKYIDNPSQFEKDFGYPMYVTVNGQKLLNTTRLTIDLFATINKDVLIKNVNGKLKIDTNNAKYRYLAVDDSGEINVKALDKFMKEKGLKMECYETFNFYGRNNQTMESADTIATTIKKALASGQEVQFTGRGFNLYTQDGKLCEKNCGGHIMTVLGITVDNKLVVDSWGEELRIDLNEVIESVIVNETFTEYGVTISKDFNIIGYDIKSIGKVSNITEAGFESNIVNTNNANKGFTSNIKDQSSKIHGGIKKDTNIEEEISPNRKLRLGEIMQREMDLESLMDEDGNIDDSLVDIYDIIAGFSEGPSSIYDDIVRHGKFLADYATFNEVIRNIKAPNSNIKMSDAIMRKLQILKNIPEGQEIVNKKEFFTKNDVEPIITSTINVDGRKINVVDIQEALKPNSKQNRTILEKGSYNGINGDNLFSIEYELFKTNPELIESLKPLFESLSSQLHAIDYYRKKISETFMEWLGDKVDLSYYTRQLDLYGSVLKHYGIDGDIVDSIISSQKEICWASRNSKSEFEFKFNEIKGGSYGTNQGAIAEILDKEGITDVINKRIFGSKSNDSKFTELLRETKMSDSEFDYEILGRLSTEKRNQVNGFIDQVISNLSKAYPGYQFSKIEALHFLYLMEGVSGSRGICNYATTVDAIVNMFKGKEALFKEKFGYDLYINGDTLNPINHERILVDLFTYINRGSLITLDPITGKPQIATNNHKYINLSDGYNGVLEAELINGFLSSKGVSERLVSTNIYNSEGNISHADIVLKINQAIKDGNSVSIGTGGYDLFDETGSLREKNGGPHIMTVVAVTSDGKLVVNSWGGKHIYDLKSEMNRAETDYTKWNGENAKRYLNISVQETISDGEVGNSNNNSNTRNNNEQSMKPTDVTQRENLETFDVETKSSSIEMIDEGTSSNIDTSTQSIPSTIEANGVSIETGKIVELIQDSSKLLECLNTSTEKQVSNIKDAIIECIDYIKENNIELNISPNVMKYYEAIKHVKGNNLHILNETSIIGNGKDAFIITDALYNKCQANMITEACVSHLLEITESLDNIETSLKDSLFVRGMAYPKKLYENIDKMTLESNAFKTTMNILSKLNLMTMYSDDKFVYNIKDVISNGVAPIYMPNKINDIKIEFLLEYINGENISMDDKNLSDVLDAIKKLDKYIKENNIKVSDSIKVKLDVINSALENGKLILNLNEFIKGETPIIIDNSITLEDGTKVLVQDLCDVLSMANSAYVSLFNLWNNYNGITIEQYNEAVKKLFEINSEFKQRFEANYEKLNSSYVYSDGNLFPKQFSSYETSKLINIINNPNKIDGYLGNERKNIIKAINELMEYGINNGSIIYSLNKDAVDFITKEVPKIDSSIEVNSKGYDMFKQNVDNGGTFGTSQGAVRALFDKIDMSDKLNRLLGNKISIKDAVNKIIFKKKKVDTELLKNLQNAKISEEELRNLLRKSQKGLFATVEQQELNSYLNRIIEIYPGMSTKDAINVLYLLETTEASGTGICNYASMTNLIFEHYTDNPTKFESDLGYPMYVEVNGKQQLNTTMLMIDLFASINKDVLVKNVGGVYEIKTTNEKYLNLSVDGEIAIKYLNKFLDAKNLKMDYSKTFKYSTFDTKNNMHYEEIVIELNKAIKRGDIIHISADGFKLYNQDGYLEYRDVGSHIMSVLGITSDGDLIVDSWGEELILDLRDALSVAGDISTNKEGEQFPKYVRVVAYDVKSIDLKRESATTNTSESSNEEAVVDKARTEAINETTVSKLEAKWNSIIPKQVYEIYELNNPNMEITKEVLQHILPNLKTDLFILHNETLAVKTKGKTRNIETKKLIESLKVLDKSFKKANIKDNPLRNSNIYKAIEIVENKELSEIEVLDKLSVLNVESNLPKGYNNFIKSYIEQGKDFTEAIKELEKIGYTKFEIANIMTAYAYNQKDTNVTDAIYHKALKYLVDNGVKKSKAINLLESQAYKIIDARGTRLLGVTDAGVEIRVINNSSNDHMDFEQVKDIMSKIEKRYIKTDLKEIIIYDITSYDDLHWENQTDYSKYRKKFVSAACGDRYSIKIWSTLVSDDIVLVSHEYGHTLDMFLANNKKTGYFSDGKKYSDAIKKDKKITESEISEYATVNNHEDFAEFIKNFLISQVEIALSYPNRYMALHKAGVNMRIDSKLIVEYINKYEYFPEIIFNTIVKILGQNEKITVKKLIIDFVNGKEINTYGNILIEDILAELAKMYPNRRNLLDKMHISD